MMRRLLALLIAFVATVAPVFAQQNPPNVSETPLSQFGVSLQSGMTSPSMGVATNVADIQRGGNYAKALNNLQMLKRGVWTSRGIGWQYQRANAFNSGAAFLDFGDYIDGSGNESMLFQVGSKVYSYNIGTSTETEITGLTGLSATALPCMRNSVSLTGGAPMTIYCNGDIEPRKITSTSASSALLFNDPGVWPGTFNSKSYSKPKFCEPFGDRMCYAGFNGNDTVFDILISNQGDPEKFSVSAPLVATDGVAFTVPPILGQIRGMRSFKLSNDTNDEVLVIGCAHGMAVITGDSADTFSMKILSRSHGIQSNRAWVQVDNNVYYLATDGIRDFASLAINANLMTESLTYLIQDKITSIDSTKCSLAHATRNPTTQEVQWWLPYTSDGSQCKHALIMNYNSDASNSDKVVPVWSTKDGFNAQCSVLFNGVFYHGTADGHLAIDYDGDTYGGTPIVFDYISPLISLGNPSQTASMRKVAIICDGQKQKFDIVPYVYSRLVGGETKRQRGTPNTQKLIGGLTGATALGSWVLGTSPFPSNHIRTLDFSPSGNGLFWEFEITASDSDDVIDFAGLQHILSGGGLQR